MRHQVKFSFVIITSIFFSPTQSDVENFQLKEIWNSEGNAAIGKGSVKLKQMCNNNLLPFHALLLDLFSEEDKRMAPVFRFVWMLFCFMGGK